MSVHRLLAATALLAVAFVPATAKANTDYPTKPIRIVVNVAPGGGVDFATRLVALKLGEKLGQPVIVENRGGGSGNIAAEFVYHSEPDGYTLLAAPGASISINDLLFKKLGYDPVKYDPVALLTSVPLALVARPNFPAKNLQEFVAYAKANPGKLNYASNGIGTAAHLTAELFNLTAGVNMVHVPYKGTNPVLNDIVADHVDLTFIQYSAFLDLYKAGRVKILAVANDKCVESMPEVPTFAEQGFPDIVSNTWNILSAPPKTPAEVLAKLNRAISEILSEPDVKQRFNQAETTVEGGSVEDARKYIAADRARWMKVIDAAHIQAE
jgi:tripartite-type tricarboxylate transporter receptor subunit TctC